jgi:molybdate transport system substrate-binding protein
MNNKSSVENKNTQRKLLILCGVTMSKAVEEIAKVFEKKEHVKVDVISDASGFLVKSILLNKQGDVFYPGSMSYVDKLKENHMILSSRYVGYNQIALVVPYGNPKKIKPEIKELLRTDISVAIGDVDYSSIGRETKRILKENGIFEEIKQKAAYIAPDSKWLSEVIKRGDVDLAINWKATVYIEENRGKLQALEFPENVAKKHYLLMSSLSCSKNVKLAEKFLDFAASYDAQEIFIKYGLSD